MKTKIFALLLAMACCFTLAGCYSEDPINVDEDESVDRFTFPQGENAYDKEIEDIYQKFGVMLIYHGVTSTDLDRSWITTMSGKSYAEEPDGEQVQFLVNYLKSNIFDYLTPEITHKVFKPYWFLLRNYFNDGQPIRSKQSGLDYWATCLQFTQDVFEEQTNGNYFSQLWNHYNSLPSTANDYFNLRGALMYNILQSAVNIGNIAIPDTYDEGFDYSTELDTRDPNSQNYSLTRGFITGSDLWGYFYSCSSKKPPTRLANFFQYIHLAMYYSDEEVEQHYPRATYPFLRGKLDIVVQYMKDKYNIDLTAIHNGPETTTTN